ncbi:hypothetical protein IFM89_000643 [Coptis chinensis]|uniref:Uncharacterized protein n=1 Tax=Coptis chinensis TaxID=261450 RepID=A0A835M8Z5_9MAGN|nr:hypothetical protein IFM89_000643 [Coptis chinensis]
MVEQSIEKLQGVVRDCVSKHLYSSAILLADKVVAFTSDLAVIYMQAQAIFLGHHYHLPFHLLNAFQIVLRDIRFCYLATKCLKELKEWDQGLVMLGDAKVDEYGNVIGLKNSNVMYLDKDGEDREINQYVFYEEGEMRNWKIVPRLPNGTKLLSRLIHYVTRYIDVKIKLLYFRLWNVSITCLNLKKSFTNNHFTIFKALSYGLLLVAITIILRNMVNRDGFSDVYYSIINSACFVLHIQSFGLVEQYTLNKAKTLDGTFLLAWIGHGNAFAAQEEGDQAMSSFCTASHSFPG